MRVEMLTREQAVRRREELLRRAGLTQSELLRRAALYELSLQERAVADEVQGLTDLLEVQTRR